MCMCHHVMCCRAMICRIGIRHPLLCAVSWCAAMRHAKPRCDMMCEFGGALRRSAMQWSYDAKLWHDAKWHRNIKICRRHIKIYISTANLDTSMPNLNMLMNNLNASTSSRDTSTSNLYISMPTLDISTSELDISTSSRDTSTSNLYISMSLESELGETLADTSVRSCRQHTVAKSSQSPERKP